MRVVTVVVVAFFPFSFVFRRSFSSFFFLLLRRAQTQRAGPAGRFGALLVCMFVRLFVVAVVFRVVACGACTGPFFSLFVVVVVLLLEQRETIVPFFVVGLRGVCNQLASSLLFISSAPSLSRSR